MALKTFTHIHVNNLYELNNLRPSENFLVFVEEPKKIFFGDGFKFTESTFDIPFQGRTMYISTKLELQNIKAIPGQIVYCQESEEAYEGSRITGVKTDWFNSAGDSIFYIPVYDFEAVYRSTVDGETLNNMFRFPDAQITVNWGDGSAIQVVNANTTGSRTYAVAGDYTVKGTFTTLPTNLNNAFSSALSLIDLITLETSMVTTFVATWSNCIGLTSFPLLNTSAGTIFDNTWINCAGITSFPLLDVSNGINFSGTWIGCAGITSFPLLDTHNGTNFNSTWQRCAGLTSFPLLDVSNGTNFVFAWQDCTGLTSFPILNLASTLSLQSTWQRCTGLISFPAINFSNITNFTNTWNGCLNLVCFNSLNFSSLINAANAFTGTTALLEPPATGTPVRNGNNATVGVWTNANPCPPVTTLTYDFFEIVEIISELDTTRTFEFTQDANVDFGDGTPITMIPANTQTPHVFPFTVPVEPEDSLTYSYSVKVIFI